MPKALPVVDALFENPYVNPARVMKLTQVSDPTARTLIRKLEKARVLKEITGKDWGQRHVAAEVLAAIENPQDEEAGWSRAAG